MKILERISPIVKAFAARKVLVLSGIAVAMLLAGGGLFAHQRISARSAAVRETAVAQQKQLDSESAAKLSKLQQSGGNSDDKPSDKPAVTPKATTKTSTTAASSAQTPKYSLSSDPRSTAYSTTPPAPNPASFNIKITRPGQVAAGTMISYNATKGERSYYGGDLILTPSVITISKSSYYNTSFSVSLPDGRIAGGVNLPWDESNQVGFVAYPSTASGVITGSPFVQLYNLAGTPAGTYQLHIVGGATNPPTSDGWEYDGFLTIVVID